MDFTIRRTTPADQDAVFNLARQLAVSFTPERDIFAASFDHLLRNPDAWLAVAVTDHQVIGYCLGFVHDTFYANGPVAWVEEITVLDALRGRGIGRALMDDFETWAADRGARLVALATRRAADFYKALGYEESAIYFRKLL